MHFFFYGLSAAFFAAALATLCLYMYKVKNSSEKFDRRCTQVGWGLAVVGLAVFAVGGVLHYQHDAKVNAAAVNTLEDRYDITVNVHGELRRLWKTDWMIDNLWRECYLTSKDISKIDTTALMCSTSDDTFVEIDDIKDDAPNADTP